MPTAPTYPGVYIEEVPSGVRTIVGVGTSVTAFVGYTVRGPIDEGVQIFNFGDYERAFGGLAKESPVSYAVQQYFANGGNEAWIVRIAAGATRASVTLRDGVGGAAHPVLTVTAKSEGAWGNNLRLDVDYDTSNPASTFNLTVTELVDQNGNIVPARVETHRNLSMSSFSPNWVEGVVGAGSELVDVKRVAAASLFQNEEATSTSGVISAAALGTIGDDHRRIAIALDGGAPVEFYFQNVGDGVPADVAALATRIDTTAKQVFGNTAITVAANGTNDRLIVTSNTTAGSGERSQVRVSNASVADAAAVLKLGAANGGREVDGTAVVRPAETGTVQTAATDLTALPNSAAIQVTLLTTGLPNETLTAIPLWAAAADKPTSLESLRAKLQGALATSPKAALSQARVSLVDSRLEIRAGGTNPNVRLQFAGTTTAQLQLTGPVDAAENVAAYAPGSAGLTAAAQTAGATGTDGSPPTAASIQGNRAAKTGIYALEDVDLFNILCIPDQSDAALLSAAIGYATERRAFVVLDVPGSVDSLTEAKQWLTDNASLRSRNAAAYFPRVQIPDPLDNGRLRSFPACGAVAGLYARTDASRGVWKAPAGTEATLAGVRRLDYVLTDPENGVLNPLGLNCIRTFPVFGSVVWGARTLDGADAAASEWKYVPVRRFALYLEESLYRGTKWVVFEPNDEPLWAQIRLNIGAFLQDLFRKGAFQGQSPREAYFVKCDKETTTQTDINLGIVNILVGFAPLKPAEFVILKIQQIAGQIPT